jgi:hypothetical protein
MPGDITDTFIKIHWVVTCGNRQPKSLLSHEVSALKGHVDDLDNRVRDAERFAGTNIEAVEIEEFNQWIDLQKDWFNMVSRDVSDAKRRVNLTKGPAKVRKSKVDKPVVAAEPADDDVSAEEEVSEESAS